MILFITICFSPFILIFDRFMLVSLLAIRKYYVVIITPFFHFLYFYVLRLSLQSVLKLYFTSFLTIYFFLVSHFIPFFKISQIFQSLIKIFQFTVLSYECGLLILFQCDRKSLFVLIFSGALYVMSLCLKNQHCLNDVFLG